MRPSRPVIPSCLALAILAGLTVLTGPAAASGFGLFQHGGRAMGQVGAFTARAPEPSATTYNPAAIVHLDGFQTQAGIDFNNAEDDYSSRTGDFSARHVIQFPGHAYATWKPGNLPFALGIGIDSPFYYVTNWDPRLFPGRFLSRRVELRVYEAHPVLAYDLGGGWSVGGGARYVFGSLEQEDNSNFGLFPPGRGLTVVEVERNASADVDDLGWDLALNYKSTAWGWGAVYRSPIQLKGDGDLTYRARDTDPGDTVLQETIRQRFRNGTASQSFEIPRELRGGIWIAPYPELRLELDASWQSWSSLENTDVTYNPDAIEQGPTYRTPRDWDDTISLRLGVEGDITDRVMMFGGVAFEPSPVPNATVEPGFPRGDAWVYGLGASYNFPDISFDVGYSRHEHKDRGAPRQQTNPTIDGSYKATDQVWGFSVRWRK